MKKITKAAANELALVAETKVEQPLVNKMKHSFHVGMLILGCGTPGPDNLKRPHLGTNLFEVTMLKLALSQ
jgi:hypothetical protein